MGSGFIHFADERVGDPTDSTRGGRCADPGPGRGAAGTCGGLHGGVLRAHSPAPVLSWNAQSPLELPASARSLAAAPAPRRPPPARSGHAGKAPERQEAGVGSAHARDSAHEQLTSEAVIGCERLMGGAARLPGCCFYGNLTPPSSVRMWPRADPVHLPLSCSFQFFPFFGSCSPG